MQARINNGKDNYLYCSVDCEVSNYYYNYDSWQECIEGINPKIIYDCNEGGYNENETEKILMWYLIKFSNSGGEWKKYEVDEKEMQ